MALTLVSTVASASANSYVDVTYGDAYWAQHYSTVKADQWAALTTPKKTSALLQACRVIDTVKVTDVFPDLYQSVYKHDRTTGLVVELFPSDRQPVRSSTTQALQFPRNLDRDDEGAYFIPETVMWAQCEQAVYLLNYDETAIANRLQGIATDSISIGQIRMEQAYDGKGTALAPMAIEYLRPFFIVNGKLRRA